MIANMGKMTGGLEAVPTASPNDGRLDVAILRTETLGSGCTCWATPCWARPQDPTLDVFQARKIVIRTPSPQPVEFDGEEGGTTRELTVEVVPKAVRVLVPAGAAGRPRAEASPRRWPAGGAAGSGPGAGRLAMRALRGGSGGLARRRAEMDLPRRGRGPTTRPFSQFEERRGQGGPGEGWCRRRPAGRASLSEVSPGQDAPDGVLLHGPVAVARRRCGAGQSIGLAGGDGVLRPPGATGKTSWTAMRPL